MKYLFFVLIVIHAVIHTIGFSNAFNLARFDQFAQTISRTAGVIWFLSFVLLFLTGILFWLEVEMWWVVSVIAVVPVSYTHLVTSALSGSFNFMLINSLNALLVMIPAYPDPL